VTEEVTTSSPLSLVENGDKSNSSESEDGVDEIDERLNTSQSARISFAFVAFAVHVAQSGGRFSLP
jgi:hypothetical protein